MEAWRDRRSPSLSTIEALASEAFAALPDEFRALCGEIVIRIDEWADDETLRALGLRDPLDLMGLFRGTATTLAPVTGQEANAIHLYRRAILDYWCEREETLGAVVSHVLIHEIGHHFGLSDGDMDAIERRADD